MLIPNHSFVAVATPLLLIPHSLLIMDKHDIVLVRSRFQDYKIGDPGVLKREKFKNHMTWQVMN